MQDLDRLEFLTELHSSVRIGLQKEAEHIVKSVNILLPTLRAALWVVDLEANKASIFAASPTHPKEETSLNLADCDTHRFSDPTRVVFVPNPQGNTSGSASTLRNKLSIPALVEWGASGRQAKPANSPELFAQLIIYPADQSEDYSPHVKKMEALSSHLGTCLRRCLGSTAAHLIQELLNTSNAVFSEDYPKTCGELLHRFIPCEGWSIFIYDQTSNRLFLRSTSGLEASDQSGTISYVIGERIVGKVAYSKVVCNIKDLYDDPRVSPNPKLRELVQSAHTSLLVAPVVDAGGELMAVIRLRNRINPVTKSATFFTRFDQELLMSAARLVGNHLQLATEARIRSRMLSLLMHEVNNPAAAIRHTATRLANKWMRLPPALVSKELGDISDSAILLSYLYDGIDRFVRPQSERLQRYTFRPCDPDQEILAPVKRMIPPLARDLAKRIGEPPPNITWSRIGRIVVCDPYAIQLALLNIIRNAIKYGRSPSGDILPIEVAITFHNAYTSPLFSGRPPVRNALIIDVIDHGIGVPEEDRDHIFAPGVRLDSATKIDAKGVGLGLSLSRMIARDHHGWLDLEGLKNPTVFRLVLPIGGPH